MPTINSITGAEFSTFLTDFCYQVDETEHKKILALSHSFLCSLPFCDDADIDPVKLLQAQGFIAYAMSQAGGGFNVVSSQSTSVAGGRLIEKNLGRSALVKRYEYSDDSSSSSSNSSEPLEILKSMSKLAYGLLSGYMCPEGESNCSSPAIFAV